MDGPDVTFTPITDPWFYAVAVPAVLLMGISKSGFGSGFGALAVPLMALAVSVPQAAAILLPLLLVMDVLGMAAYRRDVDRRLLAFLVPFALLGVALGAWLFRALDVATVAGIVGVLTLLFLAQRLLWPPRPESRPPPRWIGAVLTSISGFTSFVAHAGGPPLNAYVIPLKLKPVVFTATLAYLFFFVNLSKWAPYAWLGLVNWSYLSTSLLLLPLAPLGVWAGVYMARRMSVQLFYRVIYVGMFLTGIKLVWDGFFAGAGLP